MIAIDINQGDVQRRIINVYAPNVSKDRQEFFDSCFQSITSNWIVLGDFNLVEENSDRISGRLNSTSYYLFSLICSWNLVEPAGSQRFSFTYHHPSLSDRKSRIDHIYANCPLDKLKGYSQYISVSDHYLVGLYKLPDKDKGPKLWHLPEDALSNKCTCQNIDLILNNFNYNDPLNSWEGIKVKVQNTVQVHNKFCQKQIQQELAGLKSSLRLINQRIFSGEQLNLDRIRLQLKVEQLKNRAWFASDRYECSLEWVQNEGKMVKSFLHLEDTHADIALHEAWNGQQYVLDADKVLPVIHDFYSHLYDSCDTK